MKYTIKAGVIYKNGSQLALAKIKSAMIGPQKEILSTTGELLLSGPSVVSMDQKQVPVM